ncbi:MAG: MBL fold metallo-hydrolase [Candidatus Abyssobacteria bacterium SURF_5]|uniref:MBL fold metallo-hydrolase n=1 Tax=Abyssobacteria bacterium (strain SURF_5) TaxID=2093360 RepID=A0A3A4NL28_ABYX5|nr:MAG: MBL fold metallo-hydrolase [Candidatus Abyssubacteria bacterium SURF_5]
MVEEIMKNLYKLEIPLPGSPLKSINSYVLKNSKRTLIIDTGMNRTVCRETMQAGLKELGVDLSKTDFFVTHLHADHFGLVATLATDGSTVYFNEPDAERMHFSVWEEMISFAGRNGFPQDELQAALHNHPGYKYGPQKELPLTLLKDGDTLSIGDYTLRCVQTPGHTQGHMCLYEPSEKILFSGDHILIDITPNIQLWSDQENPLSAYLSSLDKVHQLDIGLTLPGHRRLITDCKTRIEELKLHHQDRADEALVIVQKAARNAYQVASQMTWDIACDNWEQFPVQQKWFATGEALAHLKYLEEKSLIQKEIRDTGTFYSV